MADWDRPVAFVAADFFSLTLTQQHLLGGLACLAVFAPAALAPSRPGAQRVLAPGGDVARGDRLRNLPLPRADHQRDPAPRHGNQRGPEALPRGGGGRASAGPRRGGDRLPRRRAALPAPQAEIRLDSQL